MSYSADTGPKYLRPTFTKNLPSGLGCYFCEILDSYAVKYVIGLGLWVVKPATMKAMS